MTDEDERKARAKRLREQIDALKTPTKPGPKDEAETAPSKPTSPRDQIHEKMRELDRKDRPD